MSTPCIQETKISSLSNKQDTLMELVKNINDKVDKIYGYIFEGGMEDKYATKEEASQIQKLQEEKNNYMRTDIQDLKNIVSKVTWFVVFGVLVFIGTSLITLLTKK